MTGGDLAPPAPAPPLPLPPPASRAAAAAPSLSTLFLSFLRLGTTAFGGPPMVAYIGEMAVDRKGWMTRESFADGVTLSQAIPGVISMHTAAYVGLRARGTPGALASYIGFGLPAFVLMLALSAAYGAAHDLGPVVAAFRGLHVIVVALVARAALMFGRRTATGWRDGLLVGAAAAFLILGGNPIVSIVAAALAGIFLYRAAPAPAATVAGRSAEPRPRTARAALLIAAAGLLAGAALLVADRRLFALAPVLAKVDLFAFGGGFTALPVMLHEVVDVRHWLTGRVFMDGVALGQATPGPIIITATFVGYQIAGLAGALVGTLAIFTPDICVLLLAVPYFDRLRDSPAVRRALRGILASFVGLLLAVTVAFGREVAWTAPAVLLGAAALAALTFGVDILWVVLAGAGLSALVM